MKNIVLGDDCVLQLVYIPGGSCAMGSHRSIISMPIRKIHVEGFYMAVYQTTRRQWEMIMNRYHAPNSGNTEFPMNWVTWQSATKFCERLSEIVGVSCRLPSEAEWEYAARTGLAQNVPASEPARMWADQNMWHRGNSAQILHPVGQLRPSTHGIYDVFGNLYDWCADGYHVNYGGIPNDGSAWVEKSMVSQVIRGGSYKVPHTDCSCTRRNGANSNIPLEDVGFRIVIDKEI
ncbi:MAG: formylglycine-generating enzyme family protein [bacterium]|nr:formylglycine-generating enzyme family protein [bacterium]